MHQQKKETNFSYIKAAKPEIAIPLYEKMIIQLQNDLGKPIQNRRIWSRYESGISK